MYTAPGGAAGLLGALSPLDDAPPLPALSLGYNGYTGGEESGEGLLSPVGRSALSCAYPIPIPIPSP